MRYRSIDELNAPLPTHDVDDGRNEVDRRDFLKLAGFSLAAIGVTACQQPLVENAVPYVNAPEEIVPGRAYWMASTCHGCAARCGTLVKCRDGRPIKIEGNPDHPLSKGGLCAVGQAMVLGLYDSQRLNGPMLGGKATDWKTVDAFVTSKLVGAKRVRLVTSTIPSPTFDRVAEQFFSRFEDGRRVVYDVPSASAIADAHERTHGVRAVPHYRFDKADVIVSLDADFLGTWISPVEFTKQWSAHRGKAGAWHTQLESRMSVTGGKADQRLRIHPRHTAVVLGHIAAALGVWHGSLPALPFSAAVLERIVARLRSATGRALVVCASDRVEDQLLTNQINATLGAYGSTIDLASPSRQRQGSDAAVTKFIDELRAGQVDAVVVADCNPVYDLAAGDEIAKLLARVPLVVTFASHIDETARVAHAVCPDHHALESWHDSEPVAGVYAVTQPSIAPMRNTRAAIESLSAWRGTPMKAYDLVRATQLTPEWDRTLHDGFATLPLPWPAGTAADRGSGDPLSGREHRKFAGSVASQHSDRAALATLTLTSPPGTAGDRGSGDPLSGVAITSPVHAASRFALVLYPTVAMLDGRHAQNAWLHELPDPITKVTWDNYASLSPAAATRLGVKDGDVVRVGEGASSIELPAFVQPGQHDSAVAIAIGYGRIGTDRFAKIGPKWLLQRTYVTPGDVIGRRAVQLAKFDTVSVVKTGRSVPLATTQLHNTMEGRHPVEEVSAAATEHGHESHQGNGLWPEKTPGVNQWALAIDLDRCTGCSACVIACQAENNVPVVGKDEVVREREMHWIRIDRYYEGEGDETRVHHQPVMCQHCGNAPCETVCPVLATVHSSDGLNQQVYNRCVGTRYCANNCPYKARRFNWFDYPHDDRLASLVLNPDVAVRSRGVMEKCSMCQQRIEEARIVAKQQGLPIADGAIRTACEQSCPADAITFGDLRNPKSRISSARRDPRHYLLLEELNVRPAVGYMRKVRRT